MAMYNMGHHTAYLAAHYFLVVHQAGSGAGHHKSAASDGYGDQEQLERAEKGQGWTQPWITKAHLVKSQMLNDLKSEQVLRVLLTCGRARLLASICGMGRSRGERSSLSAI